MSMTPVLEARSLTKHYHLGKGRVVQALTDVSISLARGEVLAVVGESGCGKSTLARAVTRLETPDSGEILIDGNAADDLLKYQPMTFRRSIQMVFQDPFSSVNPRRRIGDTVADGLRLHKIGPKAGRRDAVRDLLAQVGLSEDYMERYPHELSGGQRQRVAIARALAVNPQVLVCDEPVSALDVSIQAQVMNLLIDIQQTHGVANLFISHDLTLVRHIADRIAVMYLGQVVEIGDAARLDERLVHPYSQSLFAAAPKIGRPEDEEVPILEGDVPSPIDPPSGCRFHTRCPFAEPRCAASMPELRPVAGREVRCHRAEELLASSAPAGAAE